ncbi:hypothetical protein A2642_02810 [Candidatus Nomurabacteria bacterium RIFCSPHIGHO2_01_FULL_39_10]|uniref:SpoVT-AbrB domain-containing protein n=1 Tax=Candidatus Nomurabacteria bacterium RIFCSPHIGHO2_01_FULL_39_10 TaxID=1801733 RepID=A0A1F6V540_9BACT|nr:MAG: hypothetical protein A2642_02810 [Candidatus Nomurabacteria bacterium RIFCSPHIGHO2_01_FULL_39_10]
MIEEILPYKCRCGGTLKWSQCAVEFYGIDFGIRKCEVCTSCSSEYFDDKTTSEIEQEVKKRKLFGLERNISITKSGNSLVMRLPPEITKFTNLHYKDNIRIFPTSKHIEVQLIL